MRGLGVCVCVKEAGAVSPIEFRLFVREWKNIYFLSGGLEDCVLIKDKDKSTPT